MTQRISVGGILVPGFLYGTAWKEERTEALVSLALDAGFRGIDTANQRKHYYEAGVGAAITASHLAREDLFLQTKYTYVSGQDQRLPYDPTADIGRQVEQSFARSCEHLGVEVIDSYLLHGPMFRQGWSAEDREAWQAMEALHHAGRVRVLGVSNVSAEQLESLCAQARVVPAFVQNRCYARDGWDGHIRAFCGRYGIVYQAFSLLTANARELSAPKVAAIARRLGATIPQVVFRFAQAVGMLPLTGTTQRLHMDQDLAAAALELTNDDVALLEDISRRG